MFNFFDYLKLNNLFNIEKENYNKMETMDNF